MSGSKLDFLFFFICVVIKWVFLCVIGQSNELVKKKNVTRGDKGLVEITFYYG